MQALADITPCFRADGGFLPFLVFIIFAIVQVILKSGKGGEKDNSQSAEEKRRKMEQVREEIRRRIEAQRQGTSVPAQPVTQAQRSVQDPVEAIRRRIEAQRQAQQQTQTRSVVAAAPRKVIQEPVTTPLEDPMEAIRRRIEGLRESSREAEQQMADIQERVARVPASVSLAYSGAADVQHALRQLLREPQSIRQAVVLTEVLGTPKGLQ